MLHVVIMAGGSGTRFWPASRRDRPKQFLDLVGGASLLRSTFERVTPLVPADRIWVITTAATAELTARLLPELPADHVVAEPVGRDTAACAGLAAVIVRHHDPQAVCAALPADHVIHDDERFRASIVAGATHVNEEGGLLTFGIRPTRAETGYGYLLPGAAGPTIDGWTVHSLDRFVEKPDQATAESYLADGGYLWNSGMFAWLVDDLLAEIDRQLPRLGDGLRQVAAALGTPQQNSVLAAIYPDLLRTSIDFGVMERAALRWTMPVDYRWSDVGSWFAAADLLFTDTANNAILGQCLPLDSHDNVLVSNGPVIATAGIDNLVVVATPDAVLVIPKDAAQRVKELVAEIDARGWDEVL